MNKLYFAAQNKSHEVLSKSGSGGMFYALSKYVLNKKGIVYGASFTNDFKEVKIVRVNDINKIDKILTSKYLMSNAKESFSQAKKDLDSNKLVLYSGLPCQIHGLRNFLQKDYDNLICVEIVCHGTLPANMWKDYLTTINPLDREIVSINMRDKRLGWNDYGMSIKFKDCGEFFEKHQDNKYMNAFLCDKYLNKSCYHCKFKNENSKADLSIGDFWGATDDNTPFNKELGINVVVAHTEKGLKLLNMLQDIEKVEITKELASKWNGGMSNDINVESKAYDKNIFKDKHKVGVLTLNFNTNIGGVLQAYALQRFLEDNYCDVTMIQPSNYHSDLSFTKKLNCIKVDTSDFSKIKNSFDTYIVGSDQVWRRDYIKGKWDDNWKSWEPLFLKFAQCWNVKKIAYSASYGKETFDFDDVFDDVKYCLNQFDAISMREIDATNLISTLTNKDIITTCDPTLLLKREDYIKLCENIPEKEHDVFSYFLDQDSGKINLKKDILRRFKLKEVTTKQNNVEDWLASFRDCKCVLTDSYHGVLFSIIFNKPFICVLNKGRGSSRFTTLAKLFNIKDRIIDSLKTIKYDLLNNSPDINYGDLVKSSKNFLLSNIESKGGVQDMEKSKEEFKVCFGVPSWIPEKEPDRTLRKERLDRMFKQITDLFGDVNWLILAQNWKEYTPPDFVKNIKVKHEPQLGILGARKALRQFFLDEGYDYLVMLDDDILLETQPTFTKEYFFNELESHPEGFVFLQYGWSLTFCAVSRYLYQREPMWYWPTKRWRVWRYGMAIIVTL